MGSFFRKIPKRVRQEVVQAAATAGSSVDKSVASAKTINKLGSGFYKPSASDLAKMLGISVKKFERDTKKIILKDVWAELGDKAKKQIGNNPDIWIDKQGRIGVNRLFLEIALHLRHH